MAEPIRGTGCSPHSGEARPALAVGRQLSFHEDQLSTAPPPVVIDLDPVLQVVKRPLPIGAAGVVSSRLWGRRARRPAAAALGAPCLFTPPLPEVLLPLLLLFCSNRRISTAGSGGGVG